jgi:uncharacterized protein (DUF2147 family)
LQPFGNIFLAHWNSIEHKKEQTRTLSYQEINANSILGKWITIEHNLELEVYKVGDNFHAKIIWFKIEDTTRPMNTRTDDKNPNPALRHRKWLGMEVLRNLKYNAEEREWQDGIIYDAKHGREWDSVAWINSKGLLEVKGYWMFRWISKTLTFIRAN